MQPMSVLQERSRTSRPSPAFRMFSTAGTFQAGPTGWQKPAYGTWVRIESWGGGVHSIVVGN